MIARHPLRREDDLDAPSLILNVLWLVFGGAVSAIGWFFAAFIMAITIIGLPWTRAAFDNGLYTLWPFGVRSVDRERVSGPDVGTGLFGVIGNLIWFVLAGWWLALAHLIAALALAITLIGIPFAWAHVKLAGFALWPIGRAIVHHDLPRRYGY